MDSPVIASPDCPLSSPAAERGIRTFFTLFVQQRGSTNKVSSGCVKSSIFPTFKLMCNLVFVYGTLLQPGNYFAAYIKRNCTYLSPGKLKGLLYDIGEYPGAIIPNNADGYIHGSIYSLHHPEENLKVIDDYEGFGPEQDQPNLYIRSIISIETDNGFIDTWIYLYNLPVNGLPVIQTGNYTEYIKQKKSPND